jgi:hypothetical protein
MSGAATGADVVCVLGMSRSGTSLTTRILNLAGVYLGRPDELLGPDLRQLASEGEQVRAKARHSNPGGHWEHYGMMRLNESILRTLGGSWREPPPMPPEWESSQGLADLRDEARALLTESFAGRSLWGWKDPRNSLTVPFWRHLLPEMRYVICVRDPVEVAASLQQRDGMATEQGLRLWRAYSAAGVTGTASGPRVFVPYRSFFSDPAAAAARLARFVGRRDAFAGEEGGCLLGNVIDERLWRQRNGR